MHIYCITNLINGKRYIGRTSRADVRRRWNEHKKSCKKDEFPHYPLYRAMKKYGLKNFEFKSIEKINNLEILSEREAYYIDYYDCLSPKGYNLEWYQPNRTYSKESSKRMSASIQGKIKKNISQKTSKFLGVYKNKSLFHCEISKDRKKYNKSFKYEIEAAESYDKMVLFLYGKNAKINFPEKINQYFNLKDFYNFFIEERKTTSRYIGVTYTKDRNKWRSSLCSTAIKRPHLGYFNSEQEAAQKADMAIVFYHLNHQLNFPQKLEYYKSLDLKKIFRKKRRTSKYIGVSYHKLEKKFKSRFMSNYKTHYCGTYNTQEEAYKAMIKKKQEVLNQESLDANP